MDYTKQPLAFKIRKVLRYVRIFGLRRTRVKVQAQYHMNKTLSSPVLSKKPPSSGKYVAIIGCGKFSYSNIAYFLSKNHGAIIRATMDIDQNRAASLAKRFNADYFTTRAEDLMGDPDI